MVGATRSLAGRQEHSFRQVLRLLRTLGPSERETVAMLLDEEFARTVLKRGRQVRDLRNKGKLLSLDQMKKALRPSTTR